MGTDKGRDQLLEVGFLKAVVLSDFVTALLEC